MRSRLLKLAPLLALLAPLVLLALVPRSIDAQPLRLPEVRLASATPTSALFLSPSPVNNTSDSSIAMDAAGGIHVAVSAYTSNAVGTPAYYAYCAAGCADSAHWTMTPVGELGIYGGHAALALSPDGHPRMVWYRYDYTGFLIKTYYQYAECNHDGCSDNANWTTTDITAPTNGSSPSGTRYFALDPQGRPRLIISDDRNSQSGLYYAACDSGCTTKANWSETLINPNPASDELTFTSMGAPRLAAIRTDANNQHWATYTECNSACTNAASWITTQIFQVATTNASLSLQIDSQNRPRMAVYSGRSVSGNPQNDGLSYFWCNTQDCQTQASWSHSAMGLPTSNGQDVVLKLDRQDQPRMAYYSEDLSPGMGLGYAACTAGCETPSPTWQNQIIETNKDLDLSNPIPITSGCMISLWVFVGEKPSLALDATGVGQISFNVTHGQNGGVSGARRREDGALCHPGGTWSQRSCVLANDASLASGWLLQGQAHTIAMRLQL